MNIILKELHPNDVTTEYYSWFSQKDISDNITWRPSSDIVKGLGQLRDYVALNLRSKKSVLFGLYVNFIHIGNLKYENITPELSCCTVGILIGNPDFRGKGLAAKSLMEGNRIIMEKYNISFFELRVYSWNKYAISAYKKAGFIVVDTGYLISSHPEGTIMRVELDKASDPSIPDSIL